MDYFKKGYKLGFVLSNIIFGVFKGLYYLIFKTTLKIKLIILSCISLFAIEVLLSMNVEAFYLVLIFTILIILFVFAIRINNNDEEKEEDSFGELFDALFMEIKLLDSNDDVPHYLYKKDLSDYARLFAFNSFVPLNEWQKKKDMLEIYMNTNILNIKQDKKNTRVVHLIIKRQPLPTYIEYDNTKQTKNDTLTLGVGYYGMINLNLENQAHIFIAGTTGCGKSNLLKCLIHQSLQKNYDVVLIDFKRAVSFYEFSNSINVCYTYDDANKILNDTIKETEDRLDLFRENQVEDLKAYNRISEEKLHRKIIFIDELAELLKTRDKTISNSLYDSIETLTRISRAAGIHLIMGVQRPDSTVINGQIKSNVSCRVCGRFVDKEPSRIMLSNDLASKLPNVRGRFILKTNECVEFQAFYYKPYKNVVARALKKSDGTKEQEKRTVKSDGTKEQVKRTVKSDGASKQARPTSKSDEIVFDFSNLKK